MVNVNIKFLIVTLFQIHYLASTESDKNYDICKNSTGHKIYLEFDQREIFQVKNLTVTQNATEPKKCHLEIVTCPSCVVLLNFSFVNLTQSCESGGVNKECPCEYIQIFEHPFEELSRKKICNSQNKSVDSFKTQTKSVRVLLLHRGKNNHAFTLECKSIRNRVLLSNGTKNYLTSPFFPSYYLTDLSNEYVISCPKFQEENCRVRLIFSDFQIASMSIMEFFETNGQRLDVITGIHFRPPILISNGPSIVIRFYANGASALGFRAEFSFIITRDNEDNDEFITDCGGYVDNLGGGITMMNMLQTGTKKYYCFWIVRPPKTYLHFKTHLYLKVANFADMESAEIIVHQGSTSLGKILEVLRLPNTDIYSVSPREHIQPISTGFYVSLKAVFGVKSKLAVVYSAFSYKDCFSGADFLCENHHCISRQLTCDGFDHCGDGTDEPSSCFKGPNPEPTERRWYSRTPNYFFPKTDPYSDLKTATLIFIMSSLGLISLVSALFVLLYRINFRARHNRELQNHLQIITDLLEEEILDTESVVDEPPMYEPPPDYSEIIKVDCGLKDSERTEKPRRPKRKRKRGRLSKSQKSTNIDSVNSLGESANSAAVENLSGKSQNTPRRITSIASTNEAKPKNHFRKNNPLFYFSDKAISSSSIKIKSKRKWHSQGDINSFKKESDNIFKKGAKYSDHLNPRNAILKQAIKFRQRESASDSELLHIDDSDFEGEFSNVFCDNHEIGSEFRKKMCHCQGACGCATDQNLGKYFKKLNRKKFVKFYTR